MKYRCDHSHKFRDFVFLRATARSQEQKTNNHNSENSCQKCTKFPRIRPIFFPSFAKTPCRLILNPSLVKSFHLPEVILGTIRIIIGAYHSPQGFKQEMDDTRFWDFIQFDLFNLSSLAAA